MRPIIFDLDGTLIDSVPDLQAALNGVFAAEGIETFDLPSVTSFIGHGLSALVAKAMAARGLDEGDHARLSAKVMAAYSADSASRTRIYPAVVTALSALRAKGHALGLCTNKPEAAARQILDQLDLTRHFTVILGGGALPLKPDPAPLLQVVRDLGGSAAIYVGDSEVDAATAQAAGLPFLLFTEGYRKAPVEALPHDAVFDHFDQLEALVAAF